MNTFEFMEHDLFLKNKINLSQLSEAALYELEEFYAFLLYKYSRKSNPTSKKKKFASFLSSSIKVNSFSMLKRDERNER